jgi:hypothetical protein
VGVLADRVGPAAPPPAGRPDQRTALPRRPPANPRHRRPGPGPSSGRARLSYRRAAELFHARTEARGGYLADDGAQDRSLAYQRLVRELLEAKRREIVMLRNQGQISNEVIHRIERELDLEDSRLEI